jgi:membrane protein
MLTGQAFIAMIPLVLVVASALGATGSDLSQELASHYALEGELAETVRGVFERPAETTSGIGLASLVLSLIVVNSFRAVAATHVRGRMGVVAE